MTYSTPPHRTAIVADVVTSEKMLDRQETKIHFVIDGNLYAFRCDTDNLSELLYTKGDLIRKVAF